MPTLYEGETRRAYASLQQVSDDTEIDVFVSHKKEDAPKAREVAACIATYDLTAWLDELDPHVHPDADNLTEIIRERLDRSLSIMAVISPITKESWWVPFEIGIGYEKEKQFATYCEEPRHTSLPEFLDGWPLVCNHDDLHAWCGLIAADKLPRLLRESASFGTRRRAYRQALADIREALRARRRRPVVTTASLQPTHCRSNRGSPHMRARRRRDTLRPVCYGTHAGTPLTPRAPRLLSRDPRI